MANIECQLWAFYIGQRCQHWASVQDKKDSKGLQIDPQVVQTLTKLWPQLHSFPGWALEERAGWGSGVRTHPSYDAFRTWVMPDGYQASNLLEISISSRSRVLSPNSKGGGREEGEAGSCLLLSGSWT